MARDDFTAPTKRRLAGRAGHRCSNPDCRASTIGPQPGGSGVINLGAAAHITAAAPGGPRYDDSLSPEQRRDDANGIWLCANHAKAVDSDPKQFTTKLLKSWKSSAEKRALEELMGRGKPPTLPLVASIAEIRTKALAAAENYNAGFTQGPRWPSHPVKLNLRLVRDDLHESFDADTLAEATASFDQLVILAPPGTGKSTSLLQTAQAVCERRGVPAVFVPLGEWSASGKSLIEFVLAAPSFASCNRDDLDVLASEGELLLALDGWNELDQSSRKKASAEISCLRRGFPDLGFIVSTRRQALDVPIRGIQVEIDLLTEEQQLEIAQAARGEDGPVLLDKAWRTPGVRELVEIPLYCRALLSSTGNGDLPQTKEELLRHLIRELEAAPEPAEELRNLLSGRHGDLLTALAVEATSQANTSITDARARAVVTDAETVLIDAGQLTVRVEPMVVLDTLVAHHTLVRGAGPASDVAFQHQQIQEWYASNEVEALMCQAAGGQKDANESLRRRVLDNREWEEPIFFAVERLSRTGPDGAAAVAGAIVAALAIDPMLAAEMVFRSSDQAWTLVGPAVTDLAKRWHSPGAVDRAFGFMVRTGRPDFADALRKVIEGGDRNARIEAIRAAPRFRSASLGLDAGAWVATLPADAREDVLSEIAMKGDIRALEFVTAIAEADTTISVRVEVIEALAFRQANRLAARLLNSSPDEVWRTIASKRYPEQLDDPEIDRRLATERANIAKEGQDPLSKLRHAAEVTDDLTEVVSNAIADPAFPARDQHAAQVVSAALRTQATGVLNGLVKRLAARLEIPFGLDDELRASALQFDDGPIVEAVLDPATQRNIAHSCSTLIGPTTVIRLIDEYLSVCARLEGGNQAAKVDADRRTALMGLISSTRPSSFAAALISLAPPEGVLGTGVMADLIARHGNGDCKARLPLAEDKRQALVAIFQKSAETLLAIEPPPQQVFHKLARAIGRLGSPELLPALERMLDRDLGALREQQYRPPVRLLSTDQYSRALKEIGTPEVWPILIARLTEVNFGFAAALVLKHLADRENGLSDQTPAAHWPNFAVAAQRRLDKADATAESDAPPADAVFNAVAQLRREGSSDREKQLALSLAKVGTMLPHADHREDIEALLQMPYRVERLGLLQALVSDGETVAADVVLAGIHEFLEAANTAPWKQQQNLFELDEWLALLAFSDHPDAIVEAVGGLPDQIRHPTNLRRLLSALAHAPGPWHRILLELAERDVSFYGEYEWLQALMARRGPEAVTALLDLAGDGKIASGRGAADVWSLTRELVSQEASCPALRALLRDYARNGVGAAKAIALTALAVAPTADDLLLMIDLYVSDGKPFDGAMGEAVRRLALAEHTHEDWRGAYELVPKQLNGLRKQLFAMTAADSPAARLASACLNTIGAIRDEYGAPNDECRHPDIASDRPWPLPVEIAA
ncbi:hypothetical protein [Solirhodobacter olei]|uniref:hypothetical protein n=1 Tax=Solirhodobacter olei TaxID=2493082 RepID=UPI000FDC85FF|nr:hypothetical protein [Solirhodobacter olei]